MPVTGRSCHIHEYWNVRCANNEEFGPASNGLQNHRFHALAFFRSHLSVARDADCNRNQIFDWVRSNAPSIPVLQNIATLYQRAMSHEKCAAKMLNISAVGTWNIAPTEREPKLPTNALRPAARISA